ncbi:MAG: hypothetical protein P4N59_02455 [Negativicutes bacterium]|nr:hypothetical protein [Negativicutes bacterium]
MTVHQDMVCTFCGCLCDDLEVEVENNAITGVKRACLIGKNKIMHAQSNLTAPSIAGQVVSLTSAVDEAVSVLRAARYPLVYGLCSTTVEAQGEALAICELIGGTIDNPSSY